MCKILTVFTPTYNRKYIINKCYEALIRQTNKSFIWLIIDDGSKDNTEELVRKWIDENQIEIKYVWQENQGMHGAHNTAYNLIETELCVCCDSDDYLADDAVETILTMWKNKRNKRYSGIIGHDADTKGHILAEIPNGLKDTTCYDLRYKFKVKGDFKLVYRSDLMKEEAYPIIEGERYVGLGYKYFLIDQKYKMIVTNKILCYINYQKDSSSNHMIKAYVEAPKGFMFYRAKMMTIMHNQRSRYLQAIHYVSSAIFAKDRNFITKSPCKIITILALPLGVGLNLYIKQKYKRKYESY